MKFLIAGHLLDGTVLLHLDVGGLQVAMDDAALVGRFEGVGDLASDGHRVVQQEGALRQTIRKSASIDELENKRSRRHCRSRPRRDLFQSVDLRDIGVIERREPKKKRARKPPSDENDPHQWEVATCAEPARAPASQASSLA